MPSGTIRSGYGEYHSSKSQSFQAIVTACPRAESEHWLNTRPQNPVIMEGKFTDAHTPLMSMSCTRASMSQQPFRIWSKRKGSNALSSMRRPAMAFMPTWVKRWPSNSQDWFPPASSMTRGACSASPAGSRPSNMWGGSTRWSSTEMTV